MQDKRDQLKDDLEVLGLFDKANEICNELGEAAALSYLKSSYRLLSKVYHPDLNPKNRDKAARFQQRLNRISVLVNEMSDDQILDVIRSGKALPEGQKAERKKRILVVEDEFGLQEIFRDIFLMEGYEVRVAVDGDKGYEVYQKFKPDLVFTDVVMPKMSGVEMVRKIRETDPDIRVIYISGFFGIKNLKKDLDKEILQYGYPTLSKPFKTSAMLELVNRYLS
jgi:CheY-like chemotaxis protein